MVKGGGPAPQSGMVMVMRYHGITTDSHNYHDITITIQPPLLEKCPHPRGLARLTHCLHAGVDTTRATRPRRSSSSAPRRATGCSSAPCPPHSICTANVTSHPFTLLPVTLGVYASNTRRHLWLTLFAFHAPTPQVTHRRKQPTDHNNQPTCQPS